MDRRRTGRPPGRRKRPQTQVQGPRAAPLQIGTMKPGKRSSREETGSLPRNGPAPNWTSSWTSQATSNASSRAACRTATDRNNETRKALFKGRDWITTQEWTGAELDVLLDVASDLKRKFKGRVPHRYLADQTIFLMFFDKSTRTRNSFEAGMTQLGGHAHFLTADVMQVSHGESPKDTGIILSSYGHAIAIRHDLVPGEGNA